MPTDQLEDFILNNRENFDTEMPADNLWDRIETSISGGNDDDDPLEKFILENRAAFDDTTPPPRLEGRVFATLNEQVVPLGATPAAPLSVVHRRRRIGSILGIAATLLLLLAAAFTIGSNRGYEAAERDQVALELERIDPDMAAAEEYYRNEINAQFTKVSQASDDQQLIQDLAAIDEATLEIRTSLLEVPVSQRAGLVNKLIATYRTKLDILMKVQKHLPSPVPIESETTTQTES